MGKRRVCGPSGPGAASCVEVKGVWPLTNKYVGDPQIRVTNPLLLWLFAHGWEEPVPPTGPMSQVTVGLAINELATSVTDEAARKAIKSAAATVVMKNSQAIAKEHI